MEVSGFWSIVAYGLPTDTALQHYREAHPGGSPGDLLAAVMTDGWLRVPALRLAHAHAMTSAATYMYEFAWPDTMHRAWVDFASKGDAGWPCYDLDRRPVMRFDITSSVVDDPACAEGVARPEAAVPVHADSPVARMRA